MASLVMLLMKSSIVNEALRISPWIDDADERDDREEGSLFVFHSISWGPYEDVEDIIWFLYDQDPADYLILEQDLEFLDSPNEYNRGEWKDNPWDARIDVSVKARYQK